MSAVLMAGRPVREELFTGLMNRIQRLSEMGLRPSLAVVLVGDDPASRIYVKNKHTACEQLGIHSLEILLPASVSQEALNAQLDDLASDPTVTAVLLQLPLPKHLNAAQAQEHIPAHKDADGLNTYNMGLLMSGNSFVRPCTPNGIIRMLDYYHVPLEGKHAVIVGRSLIVGKPLALMLLERNCTVSICHSKTKDLHLETVRADLLISAVGKQEFITGSMIRSGSYVVDVGINRTAEGLKGDVLFSEASKKAAGITPVPGGVGLMTVAMLMDNVVSLAERNA